MERKRHKTIRYVLAIEAALVILLFAGISLLKNEKTDTAKGQEESSVILQEHRFTEETIEEDDVTEQTDTKSREGTEVVTGAETSEGNLKVDDVINEINGEGDNAEGEKSSESGTVDEEYISTLSTAQAGTLLHSAGAVDVVFYMQTDSRWADLYYGGTDTIEKYACGPTSMSIVISSLTDIKIDPVQMSAWAYQNNYWYPESGSLHSLIPDAAAAFGLQSVGVENAPGAGDTIVKALNEGKLVVALMGKGHFTKGGHFIVLRGVTEDGKILVADPASEDRTNQSWDVETITGEAKSWAAANGPFWIISKIE